MVSGLLVTKAFSQQQSDPRSNVAQLEASAVLGQSRMAVPQGLSIVNFQVPSGCRRITSTAVPSIDTGSPSDPVPVSVHFP